jgi:hypothetical protein
MYAGDPPGRPYVCIDFRDEPNNIKTRALGRYMLGRINVKR